MAFWIYYGDPPRVPEWSGMSCKNPENIYAMTAQGLQNYAPRLGQVFRTADAQCLSKWWPFCGPQKLYASRGAASCNFAWFVCKIFTAQKERDASVFKIWSQQQSQLIVKAQEKYLFELWNLTVLKLLIFKLMEQVLPKFWGAENGRGFRPLAPCKQFRNIGFA